MSAKKKTSSTERKKGELSPEAMRVWGDSPEEQKERQEAWGRFMGPPEDTPPATVALPPAQQATPLEIATLAASFLPGITNPAGSAESQEEQMGAMEALTAHRTAEGDDGLPAIKESQWHRMSRAALTRARILLGMAHGEESFPTMRWATGVYAETVVKPKRAAFEKAAAGRDTVPLGELLWRFTRVEKAETAWSYWQYFLEDGTEANGREWFIAKLVKDTGDPDKEKDIDETFPVGLGGHLLQVIQDYFMPEFEKEKENWAKRKRRKGSDAGGEATKAMCRVKAKKARREALAKGEADILAPGEGRRLTKIGQKFHLSI